MTRLGRRLRHGWRTDSLTGSCPASLELTARDFKANKENRLYMVSSLAEPGTSWLKTEIVVSCVLEFSSFSIKMSSSERLRRTLVHSRESSFGLLASLVPDTLAYAASPSPLRRRLRPAHDVCASTARYPCAVCAVSVWQRLPCTLPLYLRCSPLPAPPSALLPPSPCHRSSVQLPSSSPPSPSGCHAFPRALPPHHRPRPLCPRCLIFCPCYPLLAVYPPVAVCPLSLSLSLLHPTLSAPRLPHS